MTLSMLALVTEAYGGRGGIAQYNRDVFGALLGARAVRALDILPRSATDDGDAPPAGAVQHAPVAARLRYSAKALSLAHRLRPDVIFCGHLYMAPLAALLARRLGCRLVVQVHGIEIWAPPSGLRRRALEAADRVYCVSRDTRARVLAAADLAPEKAVVIPNTYADDYAPGDKAASRRRFGFDDAVTLLSVGRLDPRERYKGQDAVIERLPDLVARHPELVYVIAGEGEDQPRLERLAQDKGVSDHVKFLGHVARPRLPDLYRAADLFVLPSTGEGFGIVFLEAMACGTPALGLAVGGATDALGDGELGFAATRADLAQTLVSALEAPPVNATVLSAQVRERFGRDVFTRCVADAVSEFASV